MSSKNFLSQAQQLETQTSYARKEGRATDFDTHTTRRMMLVRRKGRPVTSGQVDDQPAALMYQLEMEHRAVRDWLAAPPPKSVLAGSYTMLWEAGG